MMSAGVLAEVARRAGVVETMKIAREEMHGASRLRQQGDDGVAVQTLFADDDETARARLAGLPDAIEMMLDAPADALHEKAHGLSGDLDETFHAQDVMLAREVGEPGDERRRGRRSTASSTTKLSKSSWSCPGSAS